MRRTNRVPRDIQCPMERLRCTPGFWKHPPTHTNVTWKPCEHSLHWHLVAYMYPVAKERKIGRVYPGEVRLGFLRRVRTSHQHPSPRSLRSLRHQLLPSQARLCSTLLSLSVDVAQRSAQAHLKYFACELLSKDACDGLSIIGMMSFCDVVWLISTAPWADRTEWSNRCMYAVGFFLQIAQPVHRMVLMPLTQCPRNSSLDT
jgi:hypothetical protein